MVSKQVDYAESDKLISFYVRESWKILNFNYVSYQYTLMRDPQYINLVKVFYSHIRSISSRILTEMWSANTVTKVTGIILFPVYVRFILFIDLTFLLSVFRPNFSVNSVTERALGKSCLFAKTKTIASRNSSSFN